jgi:hypothetical protein
MSALARWQSFLKKIEARHEELLAAARESLPGLVPASDFDVQPFSVAMMAIRAQCLGLSQKIDRTWSDSAEAAVAADGADTDQARELGHACSSRMELALRRAEVEVAAAAAEVLMERARAELARGFTCTHCGGPLTPKESVFRAHYLPCGFCKTVNTFEPGMAARMIEHFAAHALGERAALDANLRFLDAERRFRDGGAGAPGKEALVQLYSAQVDVYLAERARHVPDLAKDLDADRRAKLKAFIYSIA